MPDNNQFVFLSGVSSDLAFGRILGAFPTVPTVLDDQIGDELEINYGRASRRIARPFSGGWAIRSVNVTVSSA